MDEIVGYGWIELVAVDEGCKRSYLWRYLRHSRSQVVIDLRSTLSPFSHFESGRVHITSSDISEACRNVEIDDNFCNSHHILQMTHN